MPSFSIIIDDGAYVASAPSSTYPSMAEAVRSTAQTALVLATDSKDGAISTRPVKCEVQDRKTRELRRFSVGIVITIHGR